MGLVDSLTCLFEQVGRANLSNSINDQVHAMELLLDGWVHELQELSGRAKWMRDEVCFSSPPHLSPDLLSLQPTSSAPIAIGALSQIFRWHSCFQPMSGRLRSGSGTAFKMSIPPITNHQSPTAVPVPVPGTGITNHQSPITNHRCRNLVGINYRCVDGTMIAREFKIRYLEDPVDPTCIQSWQRA